MQILIWLTSNHWTTWRSTTRWTRTFEGLRGRVGFTLFHLVCKFPWQICLARALACVWVACLWLVLFLVGFFLPGNFDFNLMLIPVVDRPCLALVRQCRKKKTVHCYALWTPEGRPRPPKQDSQARGVTGSGCGSDRTMNFPHLKKFL